MPVMHFLLFCNNIQLKLLFWLVFLHFYVLLI